MLHCFRLILFFSLQTHSLFSNKCDSHTSKRNAKNRSRHDPFVTHRETLCVPRTRRRFPEIKYRSIAIIIIVILVVLMESNEVPYHRTRVRPPINNERQNWQSYSLISDASYYC